MYITSDAFNESTQKGSTVILASLPYRAEAEAGEAEHNPP